MIDCTSCVHFSLCTCANDEKDECVYYEPERPHGEWVEIENKYGTYCGCSNCKWENEHWQTQWVACPCCGADMRKKVTRNE